MEGLLQKLRQKQRRGSKPRCHRGKVNCWCSLTLERYCWIKQLFELPKATTENSDVAVEAGAVPASLMAVMGLDRALDSLMPDSFQKPSLCQFCLAQRRHINQFPLPFQA